MNTETHKIINIHKQAFGEEEGEEIAALAEALLAHPDTLSVSTERHGEMAGNVLFTPFHFIDHPDKRCFILAPLGVLPKYQGQGHGVGKELIQKGVEQLKLMGADAIFVLGIPTYYPKYGFMPTDKQTPYPELLTMPESWMILELKEGITEQLSGATAAVEPFMEPGLWDTSGRG